MTAVPIVRSFQPTRSLIASVFLGALLLHAPSLWMGFFFDDHVHQLVLDGTVHVEHMRPWNLFDFGYASDWQDVDGLLGNFPWWTSPDFSIRFLRPLTSLSLRIDHTLYGGDAVGYHVTNLLLYFFALVAVHRLYLTLGLGRWTAIGALALFSTSNGGWLAISWPANRSTLLVLIASALAVSVLERRERLGRGLALAAALACGLLACASKESGVAAFAVIGLRLLLIRRNAGDEATKRWAAGGMAAAITLALAYLLLLLGLGYGPNSMLYAPPWTDPVGYLSNLGILLTAGALELLAPVSIDTTAMLTGSMSVSVVLGTLFALPLLAYVTRAVGRERAVFFVGWTLLFTIPQASGAPADRVLLVPAFGTAALLAMFISGVWEQHRVAAARVMDRRLAIALVIAAGPLSAISTFAHSAAIAAISQTTRSSVLSSDMGEASSGHRRIILMQSGNSLLPASLGPVWRRESRDLNLRLENLHTAGRSFEWTRESDRVSTLRSLEEPFLTDSLETMYLSPGTSFEVGQRWHSESFEIEATALDADGGLRALRLRFNGSIDAADLRFLVERDGRLVAIEPPAVGESKIVERSRSTLRLP